MRIDIRYMGKIKNDFIRQGVNEYLKRINTKGWQVNIREGHKNICDADYILSERGRAIGPEELLSLFAKGEKGAPVGFLIGPPSGFKKDIPTKKMISLSPLTMTSELTVLMFMEQLYRFYCISKGKTYVR